VRLQSCGQSARASALVWAVLGSNVRSAGTAALRKWLVRSYGAGEPRPLVVLDCVVTTTTPFCRATTELLPLVTDNITPCHRQVYSLFVRRLLFRCRLKLVSSLTVAALRRLVEVRSRFLLLQSLDERRLTVANQPKI
jgi:hypothetical protein